MQGQSGRPIALSIPIFLSILIEMDQMGLKKMIEFIFLNNH